MSYLPIKVGKPGRPQLLGLGCACQAPARSALGIAVGEPIPISANASATSPVVEQIKDLQRQLNRFGPDAPADVRFLKEPLPVTGVVDMGTGIHAILVVQKRAADAFATYHDNTSRDVLAAANAGFADPVGFVNANLPDVLTVVTNYADAKGIAAPSLLSRLPVSPLVLAAGLAVGALLFWGRR